MFASALKKVGPFTRPVLTMRFKRAGTAHIGCATFIVVNADGWVVTAAHVLKPLETAKAHIAEFEDYSRRINEIKSNTRLSTKERGRQLRPMKENPDWLEGARIGWEDDQAIIEQYVTDDQADIAIVKLASFDTSDITDFPVFKNPSSEFAPGTSLCRLGYPFPEIRFTYDPVTKYLEITDDTQIPLFPLEGMYTREVSFVNQVDNRSVRLVETSSPGLLGQSGGPIFDANGHVWAIQTSTRNWRLGFSPKFKEGAKEIVEHQYLNIGYGAHVQHILTLLDALGASYQVSP